MSWRERSFFVQGAGSREQRPLPPPQWGGGGQLLMSLIYKQVCTMRFGKQVIILSGKLRFEHLFSNIMIWFS